MSAGLFRLHPRPSPFDATYLAEEGADYSTFIAPGHVLTCVPNGPVGCQEIVGAFGKAILEAWEGK